MNTHWSTEYGRLALVIFALIVVSFVTQLWAATAYLFLLGYIIWQYHQLQRLEHWISGGFQDEDALDSTGVWQALVQQLHRQNRLRKKEKQRLISIINRHNAMTSVLPHGVIVLNKNLEIEWCNPAANQRLGVKQQDCGQNICNFIRIPEFQQYLQDTESKQNFKMQSPVDDKLTLYLTTIHFGKDQRLLIARDISHRVELQRSRKLFIANASHELKTPLCVISGYLEIFSMDESLPKETREAIGNALSQSNRMRSIIDDLLLLSILENKPLDKKHFEKIDVDKNLQSFVEGLKNSGAAEQHTIEIESNSNIVIDAIDVEFNSVYMNLINNAIKHTAAGTKITVAWRMSKDRKYACFIVKDNGKGIKPEHLAHLSERFYRGDSHQTVKGTGLGLAIVKHVLERYDGRLNIKSEYGKGSTFTACFPKKMLCESL